MMAAKRITNFFIRQCCFRGLLNVAFFCFLLQSYTLSPPPAKSFLLKRKIKSLLIVGFPPQPLRVHPHSLCRHNPTFPLRETSLHIQFVCRTIYNLYAVPFAY